MSYRHKEVPEGLDVVYLKLVKECPKDDFWFNEFPKDMKVGDLTWVQRRGWYNTDSNSVHIEDNRYCGNFKREFFQTVGEEPTYEIY